MKTLKEAVAVIESLSARVEALETHVITLTQALQAQAQAPQRGARNYGPASEVPMTDEMAWRIRYGDLVATPVKTIADDHKLSRGQVYSVRGNYTFTKVTASSFRFEEIEVDGHMTTKIVKA